MSHALDDNMHDVQPKEGFGAETFWITVVLLEALKSCSSDSICTRNFIASQHYGHYATYLYAMIVDVSVYTRDHILACLRQSCAGYHAQRQLAAKT